MFLKIIILFSINYFCLYLLVISNCFFSTSDYEEPAKKAPFGIEEEELKVMSNKERIAVSNFSNFLSLTLIRQTDNLHSIFVNGLPIIMFRFQSPKERLIGLRC